MATMKFFGTTLAANVLGVLAESNYLQKYVRLKIISHEWWETTGEWVIKFSGLSRTLDIDVHVIYISHTRSYKL